MERERAVSSSWSHHHALVSILSCLVSLLSSLIDIVPTQKPPISARVRTHTWIGQSFLPIQIGVKVPAKRGRRIIEAQLLVDAINLLDVLGLELEVAFQVGLNAARGLGLGDDGAAVGDAPGQRHLCAALVVVFLADFDEGGVLDQLADAFAGAVVFVLVAKGGVLRDVDVVLLVEGVEGVLGEVGVDFDLVGGGWDGDGFDEPFELGSGEVGDADGFAFAALDELFHGFVGLKGSGWSAERAFRWETDGHTSM